MAWTESLANQVDALTGFASTDNDALKDWIASGASEIINMLSGNDLYLCAKEATWTTSNGLKWTNESKILDVFLNDGTIDQPCRKVSNRDTGRVTDAHDMDYATSSDPVYYIMPSSTAGSSSLQVIPNASSSSTGTVLYVQSSPSFSVTDKKIDNFPDRYEYIVILYAAIKVLQRMMSDKSSDLPVDISMPSVPLLPVGPIFDIGSLSISAAVPVYTGPVAVPDFAKVTTYIETDEDIELAQAKVQENNARMQEFDSKTRDALNKFNQEQNTYQNELKEKMEEAKNLQTKDATEYSAKMQLYANDVRVYTAEVDGKVKEFNAILQKHTTDYGWLQSQQKQLVDDYRRGIEGITGKPAAQQRR